MTMQVRHLTAKSVLPFALLGLAHAAASAQRSTRDTAVLLVPRDLYEYADSLGCDQVMDFYERVGVTEPPFVYVDPLLPSWETTSALWCRPRTAPPNRYTLLFRFGARAGALGECPNVISNRQHIGGLSVLHRSELTLYFASELTLEEFVYLDDPSVRGPKLPLSAPAIRSEYDGVGAIYYCHEGRWLLYSYH